MKKETVDTTEKKSLSAKKKEILTLVKQKVTEIEALRAGWKTKIIEYRKHYNGEHVRSYYSGSAKVFVNATFEAIEVIKTVVMELLFPKGEIPFDIEPVEESDAEKAREVWRPLLGFQVKKRINLEDKIEEAIYNWLITGTIVVKTPYTFNTKWVTKKGKLEDLPTDDYPDFVPWDLEKCYFDHTKKRVEDLDMVIFESIESLDNIKRNDKDRNPRGLYKDTELLDKPANKLEVKPLDSYKSHIGDVKLWEAWFNYDLNDDGIAEEIKCVVANEKLVIQLDSNKYVIQEKPILVCPFFPKIGLLGKGIPEAVFEMQIQLNDASNQTLDDASHILNRMMLIDLTKIDRASARIHCKSRPDGIIPVKHGDPRVAVVPLETPNIMDAGLLEIKLLRDWMRSISGAEYSLQGLPAAYKPTATEYSGQQNVALARIKRYAQKFERQIIKPFLRKAYEYDMQYLSRKEFLKILGKAGAKYAGSMENANWDKKWKEKIRIDCDFIPVGTMEMESKTARIQQLMTFENIISKKPLAERLQLLRLNEAGIIEELADRLSLPKDKVFFEDPTPEMMSPEDENERLKDGDETIHANLKDNHLRHLVVHAPVKEAQEHMAEHQKYMIYIENMAQQAIQGRQGGGIPTQEMPQGTSRANVGQLEGTASRPPSQF